MKNEDGCLLIFGTIVLVAVATIAIGTFLIEKKFERDAIANGAGEYVLDETGNPNFQWKECK